MDQDKTLEVTVRPRIPSDLKAFAAKLLPHLAGSNRYSAKAASDGLVIAGIWEPDIEDALTIIKQISGNELSISSFRILYIDDPYPLEPLLRIKIELSEEYLGDVIGDLTRRLGFLTDTGGEGGSRWITGRIPLAQTLGYAAHLKHISNGTGSITADFWEYFPRMPEPPKPRKAGAMRA